MLGVSTGRPRPNRQQEPIVVTRPVPTGGLNARDALANMAPTDAVVMDNWFPQPSYVEPRKGRQDWATGLPNAAVETVMAYNGVSARKLFAWCNGSLFDITAQGAVGAAIISGMSNSRWQHSMFNAGGGNVLLCVNGANPPRRYDGAAQGGIASTTTLVGGAGYVNATYTNVPLTGGTGSGAQATIVVAGNAVTSVTITMTGAGYVVGDVLSASNANLGGAGSGFSVTVQTVAGWSVTTISGTHADGSALNPSNLITVTVFKQRTWYIEANTMNVWYSGVQAYQGALTMLPLGSLFKLGGYLMQMATWTIDNVSGINDYAAFITSEGEVALYQGYDPSSVNTWSLVGIFRVGRPIGRRCYTKYGSDILLLCADGLVRLSEALLTDRTQPDITLTDKIRNSINQDVQNLASNFGWQVIEHPIGNKLIVNAPDIEDSTSHQWVMNTISVSNAWCRFLNWNAMCWEVQQDSLYFGGVGKVSLADVGYSDAGAAITVDCKPAFSYFDIHKQKQFHMVRPVFQASAKIRPSITLNLDFQDVSNPGPLFTSGLTAPWNTSPWNITPWGGTFPILQLADWIGVAGIGYAASGRLQFQISNVALRWQSIDYLFEEAGAL